MTDDEDQEDTGKPTAGGRGTFASSVAGHRLIQDMRNTDEWVASDCSVLDLLGEFEQADPP